MGMNEQVHNQSERVAAMVARLARLVRARFRGELRFIPFTKSDPEHCEIRERLLRAAPLKLGEAWIFPVMLSYQIVGCAEVKGMSSISEREAAELADLIELYLDATLALTDRVEALGLTEEQLKRAALESANSNVIHFRRPADAATLKSRSDSSAGAEGNTIALSPRRPLGFALASLIEGSSHGELKAAALELHELSGRYAFLFLSDLEWETAAELKELGPVTLYIPDVTKLNAQEQAQLAAYLNTVPSVMQPQLIVGTLKPLAELRDDEALAADLIRHLSTFHMRIDRPLADYQRDGIAKFFFASLTRGGPGDGNQRGPLN
jgi:hypothetical protein